MEIRGLIEKKIRYLILKKHIDIICKLKESVNMNLTCETLRWTSLILQILLLTLPYFGQVSCSDIMSNTESHVNNQKRVPPSGSGGGTFEKRSSYAAISQAMTDTINNEFGSEYDLISLVHKLIIETESDLDFFNFFF